MLHSPIAAVLPDACAIPRCCTLSGKGLHVRPCARTLSQPLRSLSLSFNLQEVYVRESLGVAILPASQRPAEEEEVAQVRRTG